MEDNTCPPTKLIVFSKHECYNSTLPKSFNISADNSDVVSVVVDDIIAGKFDCEIVANWTGPARLNETVSYAFSEYHQWSFTF